jgi:peroxiredoxin
MSLRQTLQEMLAVRPERYRALLSALAVRLDATAVEGVLRPGDRLPDFVLPDAEGKLISSDDLLANGPLIVVLVRGDWCPFCKTTLVALNAVLQSLEAAGAGLVALTPDTGEYVTALWRDLNLHFPVLSDVDAATAFRLGAMYRVPDALRQFWLAAGIDLALRHGDPWWFLPMPATFVADRTGIIRYSYASGDITDRVDPDAIVALMRDIAAEGGAPPRAGG